MIKVKIEETDEESELLKGKLQEIENLKDANQELEETVALSLQDELSTANVKNDRYNSVEIRSEKNKKEKKALFKHLDVISKQNNEALAKLKESCKKLQSGIRCRFGWKCKRLFCKYDHSYLHRKINYFECREVISCNQCQQVFKNKSELSTRRDHMTLYNYCIEIVFFINQTILNKMNHFVCHNWKTMHWTWSNSPYIYLCS